MCRGLLILFLPFRDEMSDIHSKDVELLVFKNRELIVTNRQKYEKYKGMADIINNIENRLESEDAEDKYESDEVSLNDEDETTTREEMKDFHEDYETWIRNEANKSLSSCEQFLDMITPIELRKLIIDLNQQQRKIFDDLVERECSPFEDKEPYHLFIGGLAGTGKSYLMRVLMEAFMLSLEVTLISQASLPWHQQLMLRTSLVEKPLNPLLVSKAPITGIISYRQREKGI